MFNTNMYSIYIYIFDLLYFSIKVKCFLILSRNTNIKGIPNINMI